MKKKRITTKTEHLSEAIWNNTYDAMMPQAKSMGFKTPAVQYQMQNHYSAISVAEDFLLNSRILRNDREFQASVLGYLSPPGVTMVSLVGSEDNPQTHQVNLPKNVPLTMELGEALLKRRSVRRYTGDACRFDYLATMIRATSGIVSEHRLSSMTGNTATMHYRTAPSGGALYPIDLYVVALNVKELIHMDLTTTEANALGLVVSRVWSPNTLSLSLPSSVPSQHPRFKAYGGITHDALHPYP